MDIARRLGKIPLLSENGGVVRFGDPASLYSLC